MGVKERRERERAYRRKQILDAARKLLFTKGLEGVSINQIAKLAELGVASIYTYFQNKDEVIIGLTEEGLDVQRDYLARRLDGVSNPEEKLRCLAQGYLDFSVDHPNYFAVISSFLSSPTPVLTEGPKEIADQRGSENLALLVDAIREGINQGVFDEVAPLRFSLVLWGSMHGMIQLSKLQQTIMSGIDHGELYAEAVDRIIGSITK